MQTDQTWLTPSPHLFAHHPAFRHLREQQPATAAPPAAATAAPPFSPESVPTAQAPEVPPSPEDGSYEVELVMDPGWAERLSRRRRRAPAGPRTRLAPPTLPPAPPTARERRRALAPSYGAGAAAIEALSEEIDRAAAAQGVAEAWPLWPEMPLSSSLVAAGVEQAS